MPTNLCYRTPCIDSTQCESNTCKDAPSTASYALWAATGFSGGPPFGSCTMPIYMIGLIAGGVALALILLLILICICRCQKNKKLQYQLHYYQPIYQQQQPIYQVPQQQQQQPINK